MSQRSIMSFFSPRQKSNSNEGKEKSHEKEDLNRSPLKTINGGLDEEDHEVVPKKKIRRLLDSEDEDEEDTVEIKKKDDKPTIESKPELVTPQKSSQSSSKEDKTPPSGSSVTDSGGVRKRKTARKHMRKVKSSESSPSFEKKMNSELDIKNEEVEGKNDGKLEDTDEVKKIDSKSEEEKDDNVKQDEIETKEQPASTISNMKTSPISSSKDIKTPTSTGSGKRKYARKHMKRKNSSKSSPQNNVSKTTDSKPSEPTPKRPKPTSPETVPKPHEITTPTKPSEKEDVSNNNSSSKSKDKNDITEKVEKSEKDESSSPSDIEQSKPTKKAFCWPGGKTDDPSKATVYKPGTSSYHPTESACWKKGEKVPYLALATTLELIEETSGRLKICEILADYLWSVIVLSPEDLLSSVYLCLNKLAPAYEGVELKVGDGVLIKAIAAATGRATAKLKAECNEKGDLGIVAQSSKCNQRVMFAPPKLTLDNTFKKLREIANFSGNSSMSKKVDVIKAMLIACRGCESKYIIRSLSGKLRIGLAEQSVLVALSHAVALSENDKMTSKKKIDESMKTKMEKVSKIIKTAYCEMPTYEVMLPAILKHGVADLPNHCKLTPGIPLKPMLAHPTKGITEVFNRFQEMAFTCEFKYDGERAQIHILESGDVHIYSRNQENNTTKYPDIISRMPKILKSSVKSAILDAEAVAWDTENKQILPFQILSTRKRKDATIDDIKVQVCVFAFDLLYFNGEALVRKPLRERRDLLIENFQEVEGEFVLAKSMISSDTEDIQSFLDESIKGNCEGLMVKTLDKEATYEISKRSHNWLKIKKDYLEGTGDTLDLVVIGGYHGKGKRAGAYGGFLLACYDEESEEYQSICKIGTGLKDDELEKHGKYFAEHILEKPRSYYRFDSSHTPDHWFDAVQVWEVKAADLSISPVHKAAMGIVEPSKGISLRFPRFIRIRDDKKPEEATSGSQVADMYNNQDQIKNQASGAKQTLKEEDFY